eukprot:g11570.t1
MDAFGSTLVCLDSRELETSGLPTRGLFSGSQPGVSAHFPLKVRLGPSSSGIGGGANSVHGKGPKAELPISPASLLEQFRRNLCLQNTEFVLACALWRHACAVEIAMHPAEVALEAWALLSESPLAAPHREFTASLPNLRGDRVQDCDTVTWFGWLAGWTPVAVGSIISQETLRALSESCPLLGKEASLLPLEKSLHRSCREAGEVHFISFWRSLGEVTLEEASQVLSASSSCRTFSSPTAAKRATPPECWVESDFQRCEAAAGLTLPFGPLGRASLEAAPSQAMQQEPCKMPLTPRTCPRTVIQELEDLRDVMMDHFEASKDDNVPMTLFWEAVRSIQSSSDSPEFWRKLSAQMGQAGSDRISISEITTVLLLWLREAAANELPYDELEASVTLLTPGRAFGKPEEVGMVDDDQKSDLDRLLEKGADPSYRGKRSQTALHEAAFLGRAYCIKELLRVMPELLVEKDRAGQTALHCAAAEGQELKRHQSSLEELLGMRQIPREVSLELLSARTYKIGWTALHYAAHNGHAECCRVLMSAAGQAAEFIGAVTDTGRTALHLASVNGHRRCLTVLLRTHMAKQLMTSQSRDGHTAMHLAARFGQPSCVKVLAKKLPELVKVGVPVVSACSYAGYLTSEVFWIWTW